MWILSFLQHLRNWVHCKQFLFAVRAVYPWQNSSGVYPKLHFWIFDSWLVNICSFKVQVLTGACSAKRFIEASRIDAILHFPTTKAMSTQSCFDCELRHRTAQFVYSNASAQKGISNWFLTVLKYLPPMLFSAVSGSLSFRFRKHFPSIVPTELS